MSRSSTIRGKLALSLGLSLGLVFFVSGYLVIRNVFRQTQIESQQYMESLSREYAARLEHILEIPLAESTSLAVSMAAADAIPAPARRTYLMNTMRTAMEANSSYYAVWTMWEPDALDGADNSHIDDSDLGSDEAGRFTPYFFREGSSIEFEATSWEEENGEDYYVIPKQTMKEYLTEPYPYEIRGKEVMMVSTVAPIIRNGRFLGVAGLDIALEDITAELGSATLYETGFGRLISSKGIVVTHPDPARIGETAPEWSSSADAGDISDALNQGKTFTKEYWSESLKRTTIKSFVPIFIGSSSSPWVYGTVVPEEETYAGVMKVLQIDGLILVFGYILILFILWTVSGALLRPLKAAKAAMGEIAEGDGDLTRILTVKTRDEVGALADGFNGFTAKLRSILEQVRTELTTLRAAGETLGRDASSSAAAVTQINGTISNVGQSVNRQTKAVSEVSASIEQIVGNIASLDRLIDEQGRSLELSASAVEEMVANVQSITQNLDAGKPAFGRLSEASNEGYENLASVGEIVNRIAVQSSGLEETNSVINAIASQTNLLAMNAAIEAAHAGDAGKGFAVVADEIRKLAEDAAQQSREISATLAELDGSIQQAVSLSGKAGDSFESIRASVGDVTARQEEIRAAVNEQSEGNRVVLENMGQLRRIGTEVTSGSAEMAAGSEAILRAARDLAEVSAEVNLFMEEISEGTAEINSLSNRVSTLSSQTLSGIDSVDTAVGRFKF